jgi:hypothetical protein
MENRRLFDKDNLKTLKSKTSIAYEKTVDDKINVEDIGNDLFFTAEIKVSEDEELYTKNLFLKASSQDVYNLTNMRFEDHSEYYDIINIRIVDVSIEVKSQKEVVNGTKPI